VRKQIREVEVQIGMSALGFDDRREMGTYLADKWDVDETSCAAKLYGRASPEPGNKRPSLHESSLPTASVVIRRQVSKCTTASNVPLPSAAYVLLMMRHWYIFLLAKLQTARNYATRSCSTFVTGLWLNKLAHGLATSSSTTSTLGSMIPQDMIHP